MKYVVAALLNLARRQADRSSAPPSVARRAKRQAPFPPAVPALRSWRQTCRRHPRIRVSFPVLCRGLDKNTGWIKKTLRSVGSGGAVSGDPKGSPSRSALASHSDIGQLWQIAGRQYVELSKIHRLARVSQRTPCPHWERSIVEVSLAVKQDSLEA